MTFIEGLLIVNFITLLGGLFATGMAINDLHRKIDLHHSLTFDRPPQITLDCPHNYDSIARVPFKTFQ